MAVIDKQAWHMREHHSKDAASLAGSEHGEEEPCYSGKDEGLKIASPKSGMGVQAKEQKVTSPNFFPNIVKDQNFTMDGGMH